MPAANTSFGSMEATTFASLRWSEGNTWIFRFFSWTYLWLFLIIHWLALSIYQRYTGDAFWRLIHLVVQLDHSCTRVCPKTTVLAAVLWVSRSQYFQPPSMASNSTTTIPLWFQQKSRHEENLPPPGNDFRDHRDRDNGIEDIWGFHVPHAYVWALVLLLGLSMGLFLQFQ